MVKQQNRSMLLDALLCGSAVTAPLHAQPLSTNSTIRDVLTQPTFQDFAERLLPWDDGREPPNLSLNRVAELMPYHSHIHPAEIVETLNHMGRRSGRGAKRCFTRFIQLKKLDVEEQSVRLIGRDAILLNKIRLTAVVNGETVTNPFGEPSCL